MAPTIGPYVQGKPLGRGHYGKVTAGEHIQTRQKVALKLVPDGAMSNASLEQEIAIQRKLHHQHVVRLYDVIDSKDGIVLAMELLPGGDLLEYLRSVGRLPEAEAQRLFRQLIAAVQHCHDSGIVHRDIKPENILLDSERNIKLCDFGLAAELREGHLLTESVGSPKYAAPELLQQHCEYNGPQVDVWSCGVVLYSLLCNSLPFNADSIPDLFKRIQMGHYCVPDHISKEAKDLLARMLTVDPARRITLQQLVLHPWFARDLLPSPCVPGPRAPPPAKVAVVAAARAPDEKVPEGSERVPPRAPAAGGPTPARQRAAIALACRAKMLAARSAAVFA